MIKDEIMKELDDMSEKSLHQLLELIKFYKLGISTPLSAEDKAKLKLIEKMKQ